MPCAAKRLQSVRQVLRLHRLRALRACLVSNRVGLGGAESAPFTRGTASRGPSLRGGFFSFRSVSTKFLPKRALRRVLRVRQKTPKVSPSPLPNRLLDFAVAAPVAATVALNGACPLFKTGLLAS